MYLHGAIATVSLRLHIYENDLSCITAINKLFKILKICSLIKMFTFSEQTGFEFFDRTYVVNVSFLPYVE